MPLRKWCVTAFSGGAVSRPMRFWTYKGALKRAESYTSDDHYHTAYIEGPMLPYVAEFRRDWRDSTASEQRELSMMFPQLYQAVRRCVLYGDVAQLATEWRQLGRAQFMLFGRTYYSALANVAVFHDDQAAGKARVA